MSWIQNHAYYHFTPRTNLRSILRHGLRVGRSQGKIKAVWLCTLSQLSKLREHIADHHGVGVNDLVCLRVRPRLTKLVRRRRGIWIHLESIPPCRIDIT